MAYADLTSTKRLSSEISDAVKKTVLGNNIVRISLLGNGNVGTGRLTAISQSGKSATCLVNYDNCDCPDESHLLQKG